MGVEESRLYTHMIKPFSRSAADGENWKVIFNYRLSRIRRIFENETGHLSLKEETTADLILVVCCLYKLLRDGYMKHRNYM